MPALLTVFVRHPKGVKLTPAGQALLPEARMLLERATARQDSAHASGARQAPCMARSKGWRPVWASSRCAHRWSDAWVGAMTGRPGDRYASAASTS
jgi:DNA-binding transcriptional LysR family regulator